MDFVARSSKLFVRLSVGVAASESREDKAVIQIVLLLTGYMCSESGGFSAALDQFQHCVKVFLHLL